VYALGGVRLCFLVCAVAGLAVAGCRGCSSQKARETARPAPVEDGGRPVLDAAEIERATGTASPYLDPPQDVEPLEGLDDEERPPPVERVAGVEDDEDPDEAEIPETGPFAEEPPAEEREVPADIPDAGIGDPDAGDGDEAEEEPAPLPPLDDAGDPLPDPDTHGG
jgi:hypothetical protein